MIKNSEFISILNRMMIGKVVITATVIFSFFGVIVGIGHAMHTDTEISGEWKEILLLMLGALIGAFGKVIDHWFTDTEKDKKLIDKITSITKNDEDCKCDDCIKKV
jgi:H+/Cl- antiporter ClcA